MYITFAFLYMQVGGGGGGGGGINQLLIFLLIFMEIDMLTWHEGNFFQKERQLLRGSKMGGGGAVFKHMLIYNILYRNLSSDLI